MNSEQAKSFMRWVSTVIGPFLIARGYASEASLQLYAGVFVALAPLVWSMIVHTDSNAVAVVDAIARRPDSPIRAVVTEGTPAGKEIAASLPGNTTVVAGTSLAAKVVAQ